MDADLILSIGLFLGFLAIPAIVGAWADGRPPRVAALVVVIAGGMIVFALTQKPGGYTLEEIPGVFISVVSRVL